TSVQPGMLNVPVHDSDAAAYVALNVAPSGRRCCFLASHFSRFFLLCSREWLTAQAPHFAAWFTAWPQECWGGGGGCGGCFCAFRARTRSMVFITAVLPDKIVTDFSFGGRARPRHAGLLSACSSVCFPTLIIAHGHLVPDHLPPADEIACDHALVF